MSSSVYSPFLFEGVVFRKASAGRFPTTERRSEFQSVRESTYVAVKKGNMFQLSIALPGLRQRDLNVNLNNNRLIVTGTRSYISTDSISRKRYKFQQTFFVDDSVDKNRLTADLKNQVLTLSVPEINLDVHQVTDESEIEKNDSIDSEESLSSVNCIYTAGEQSQIDDGSKL